MRCLSLLVLWALLCGCVPTAPRPELALPEIRLLPASLGASLSLEQRITLQEMRAPPDTAARDTVRSFDALLEIDAASVRLAGMVMGRRVLRFVWDGQSLREERDASLPPQVDAARVLRDIHLVYWPLAALQAELPAGWRISQQGSTQRILGYRGRDWLTVDFAAGGALGSGRAKIDNRLEGYILLIESTARSSD